MKIKQSIVTIDPPSPPKTTPIQARDMGGIFRATRKNNVATFIVMGDRACLFVFDDGSMYVVGPSEPLPPYLLKGFEGDWMCERLPTNVEHVLSFSN